MEGKALGLFILFLSLFCINCVEGIGCQVCQIAVQQVYDYLDSNRSFALHDLQKVCYIPAPMYFDLCDRVVEDVYFQVVDIVENKVTPKDACTKFGLCRSLPQLFNTEDINIELFLKTSFIADQIFSTVGDKVQSIGGNNPLDDCISAGFNNHLCELYIQ